MATPADIIGRGATGSKPAAGIEGRLYFDTTLEKLQRDSGADWEDCDPVVTGASDNGWIDADETWTYASADDPTFTFTIADMDATAKYSPGMRIKLTQTSVKYFIITKVVFDDPGSTITVYGGTDYDLADAAISENYYSTVKAPLGFPLDPIKWTEEFSDTSLRSQATPTQNTWYNVGSLQITIPIGIWKTNYQAAMAVSDAAATIIRQFITLSTANNSESDVDFTSWGGLSGASGDLVYGGTVYREKILNLSSKTVYYLNMRTTTASLDSIGISGANSKTIIRAVCTYL